MTDKATVLLFDPVTAIYAKSYYGKLKKAVRKLENFALKECPYYTDISCRQYKDILRSAVKLPKLCSDECMAVEGKWFSVVQIGWLKGVPLVTIEMENNEWDPG